MLNSRILVALMSAVSSLGKSVRPWGNEPAPTFDPTAGWNGGHSRSRLGTRSNLRYVHKVVEITHMVPARYDWETGDGHGLMAETRIHRNVPKRRGEHKGINTVPRGFGGKNAIRF